MGADEGGPTEERMGGVGEAAGAAVAALRRGDAAALERLAAAAKGMAAPRTAEERREAEGQLRALGRLVGLTRGNLRLLRGDYGAGYGPEAG